jgi:thioredoxin-like negative regulator of GroEL
MLALLACGGTDTAQTSGSEAMPPVSTAGEAAPAPEIPEPIAEVEPAPEVGSCLNLIQQKRFQEALPACLAALEIDPDNLEVQAAVEQAQSEAGKLAAAEAAESAPSEAAAQAAEAAKALPGQPGQ